MCGRFSFTRPERQMLLNRFGLSRIEPELQPRYNIAPSQDVPVIIDDAMVSARWGFVPSWADSEGDFKTINARAETIDSSKAYKEAFKSKRCLVPADSFFEWNKFGMKIPYRIMREDEEMFAFAGIYSIWKRIRTFSIITTEPNELMRKIHARMPVILERKLERDYLSASLDDAKDMLKPYPGNLKMYEVSRKVNKPENDSPDVIREVERKGLDLWMSS